MNIEKIIQSSLKEDAPIDRTAWFAHRDKELSQIIDALKHIHESNYWKLLQEKLFDGVVSSIEKRLRSESDEKEIYRLQGQLVFASKYIDLNGFVALLESELSGLRKQHAETKKN